MLVKCQVLCDSRRSSLVSSSGKAYEAARRRRPELPGTNPLRFRGYYFVHVIL
jgi:hypothetical protein